MPHPVLQGQLLHQEHQEHQGLLPMVPGLALPRRALVLSPGNSQSRRFVPTGCGIVWAMQLPRNVAEVSSPALLLYPDRVEQNLRRMIALAGGTERLRPHLKTHKLGEVLQLQKALGITKVKCATIAEAELAAVAGIDEVLLAYPLVGPNVERFRCLVRLFPETRFQATIDSVEALAALAGSGAEVLLDLDCGMHRTGLPAGPEAALLYEELCNTPGLIPGGLHAYDGHLAEPELAVRQAKVAEAFAPVFALRERLLNAGLPVPRLIASGTPTFPVHAANPSVECSPGTCVLWDAGYAAKCPDLDFLHAALVLTRVISKPGPSRLCLDLGYKAIAAENPHPRVLFPALPDAVALLHSEEHLVVETAHADAFPIGTPLLGIPWHICPTVALYAEAVIVHHHEATERWPILARARKLTV